MATVAQEEDQLAEVTKAVEELYELRDSYFMTNPHDKIAKLRFQYDLALMLLDSINLDQSEVPAQRGTYNYVRGKILDIVPHYCKEAEDHFFKAVNLNPSLVDAWLCLGNCIWKRGDLSAAKDCFILGLSKGPNNKILCLLSKLTRKMAQGAENKTELVKESIQLARKAITLDVNCGNSWHNLGNAYLTSFFATGGADRYNLMQSFKAYQNAEKDERLKSSAELSFNSAMAHKYLNNFESALTRFEVAAALGYHDHEVLEMIQDIVNLLDKLDYALKEHARAMKLASAVLDLVSVKQGPNQGAAILGKVLFYNKHEIIPPMYFLICDSETECFALSVYRLQYNTFKIGDELILLEPVYYQYDFSWKGKEYKFKLIRLDYINQAIVNRKKKFQPQGIVSNAIRSCSSACTSMHRNP